MPQRRLQKRDSQRFGVVGAGAIATVLSLYHFLNQVANEAPRMAEQAQAVVSYRQNNLPSYQTAAYSLPSTSPSANSSWGNQYQQTQWGNLAQPNSTTLTSNPPNMISSSKQNDGRTLAFSIRSSESTRRIAGEILRANKQVLYMAQSVYAEPLAVALAEVSQRGVPVYVMLDGNTQTQNRSVAEYLAAANVRTSIITDQSLSPVSVVLIDGHTVIFGSFDGLNPMVDDQIVVARQQIQIYDTFETAFMSAFRRSIAYIGTTVSNRSSGYGSSANVIGYTTSALGTAGGSQPVSQAILGDRPSNLARPPSSPTYR